MIRIVKSDDHVDDIIELDGQCFDPDDAPPVQVPAHAECWVALDGDDVVGYLVAHITPRGVPSFGPARPTPRLAHYVDRYGVAQSHAGRGIGKRLLRAWLRWASRSRMDGDFAWTYTSADNAQSINALSACGFKAWRPSVLPGTTIPPKYGWCIWRKDWT